MMEMSELQSLDSESDVVEFLSEYCEFGEGRVYVLSVMARPRENDSINHGGIPMFREIITEESGIQRKVSRLRAIAESFTPEEGDGSPLVFRMYISANARDVQKSFHLFQKHLLDLNKKYSQGHDPAMEKMERLDREWESHLQSEGNKDDDYFIIDVDEGSMEWYEEVREELEAETEVLAALESPNGFHIIVEPFNFPASRVVDMEEVEIKNDSLMFLWMFEQSQ